MTPERPNPKRILMSRPLTLPEGMTEVEYIARGDAIARSKALVDEWAELKRLGPVSFNHLYGIFHAEYL